MNSPIRILFLAANPHQTDRLQLGEEIRTIGERLRLAEYRESFDLEQHHAVRQTDLAEFLLRRKPHIVHFSGHGSAQGEIVLEDSQGRARTVPPEALRDLFHILKDNIRVVVLNACWSAAQAEAIAQEIDCVIGMARAIGDADALHFSGGFYRGLGFGRSVQTAFDLGKNEIDLTGLPDSAVPQLLVRKGVNPGQLFFAGPEAATRIKPEDVPVASPKPTGKHVFISYSRADRDFVARLTGDLERRGINIWIDKKGLKAGTPDWEQALRDALHSARAVLLVASRASRQSRYVKDELGIAAMYKRALFPVWAVGEEWLDCIPMGLGNTQFIDAVESATQRRLMKS